MRKILMLLGVVSLSLCSIACQATGPGEYTEYVYEERLDDFIWDNPLLTDPQKENEIWLIGAALGMEPDEIQAMLDERVDDGEGEDSE